MEGGMASSTALRKDRQRKQRRRNRDALRRARKGAQLALDLRPTFAWGGPRLNAGRPVIRAAGEVVHRARETFRPTEPLHLSFRLRDGALDLCAEPWFDVFVWSLRRVARHESVRVVAYSAQGNHVHLVVE